MMLPRETKDLDVLRNNNALYVSQLFENGNRNLLNSAEKFQENFKEWSITLKVNNQQIGELWSEMAGAFSGQGAVKGLMEKPGEMDKGDAIMDD